MAEAGGEDPDDPHEPGELEPDELEADEDGGMFWQVPAGQPAVLIGAYRSAVRQAEELSAALAAAGLADQVVAVTAGLDAAGEPLVCGVITFSGVRKLAALLAAGEVPHALALHEGVPPWAA